MAQFVFLDTNNWIYLANGFNILANDHDDLHLKVFDIIERRTTDGSLVFLVNDLILEEFERNKIQTELKIQKIEKKAKTLSDNLKPLRDFLPEDKVEINALKAKVIAAAEQKILAQRAHIA